VSEETALCTGCGVPNAPGARACGSCGTLLPARTSAAPFPRIARPNLDRAGGVAVLFVALMVAFVATALSARLGIGETALERGTTAMVVLMAVVCTIAAWGDVAPLLARTGGWRSLLLAPAGFGLLVAFGALYFPLLRAIGVPMLSSSSVHGGSGSPVWVPYLLMSVAPGLFEELLFRGYVMARLDLVLTPRETLAVQAALFSMVHFSLVILPSHFVIGLVLGLLRRRTGSLYPGMAVHMAWNAAVVHAELQGGQFV
jgi:membrane protease YdiL (CAAX protease family)